MTQKKYFGTDGIRGRVGDEPITPEFAMRLGRAAGRVLATRDTGVVVIGKDTRRSGYMLEAALQAGLISAGADVRMLGPMPTPGVAYLTRAQRLINAGLQHRLIHTSQPLVTLGDADGKRQVARAQARMT